MILAQVTFLFHNENWQNVDNDPCLYFQTLNSMDTNKEVKEF